MKKLKGSSNYEMIIMMVLLILFASSIYTMIYAGISTQERILNVKNSQINTRVATSYLNVKLKQNDKSEKISIVKNPMDGKDAIVLHDQFNDGSYDTWIYFENKKLVEQLVEIGSTPSAELGFEIAEVEDFQVELENNLLQTTISYKSNNQLYNITSKYALKSAQN